ncbi:MAG TPA: HD domain-containing protein [Thermoanaerobaculia bacterium]|nr:HD domain-containing protein [Thermoanaerobaculia bacterium]
MIDREEVVRRTAAHVRQTLEGEPSGHDWWHVYRVWKNALAIAREEPADRFVVELAALLHDLSDRKLNGGDVTLGPKVAREWLETQGVPEEIVAHVCEIIADLSFKGAGVPTPMRTREGEVVQDADRLDAIGAIGIARTFAYGGHKGRLLHDPEDPPAFHASVESYYTNQGTAINHFYEKLLLLADRMNTETAQRIALGRHAFLEEFLERFHAEWEGRDGE